ncbi:MAG: type II toxin-antitoxin system VapC family toxin [Myxococcota bacterium]
MGLIDDLGSGPVGIDTAVFIYFMEDHAVYAPLVAPLFEALDRGEVQAATSALTLLEVLVVPYRRGDAGLAERYEALLTRGRGLEVVDPTRPILRAAANLRAVTGVKTPDALHLASAMAHGCSTFLTNDRDLPRLPSLRVVQLATWVRSS